MDSRSFKAVGAHVIIVLGQGGISKRRTETWLYFHHFRDSYSFSTCSSTSKAVISDVRHTFPFTLITFVSLSPASVNSSFLPPSNGQISYCAFKSEHRGNKSSIFPLIISISPIHHCKVHVLENAAPLLSVTINKVIKLQQLSAVQF